MNKIKNCIYKLFKDRLYEDCRDDLLIYYIEQELPFSEVNNKDKKVIEALSNLYSSEGYRTYVKMLGNYKNRLGSKLMKVDSTENRVNVDNKSVEVRKFSDVYWRGFYNGQAYFISYILTLIKRNYTKYNKKYNKAEEVREKKKR